MLVIQIGLALFGAAGLLLGIWQRAKFRRQSHRFASLNEKLCVVQKDKQRLSLEIGQLKRIEVDLRESENFNRALFEATQTGLIIVNPETHQIFDANTAAGRLLGWDPEEILGQPAAIFMNCPTNEKCTARGHAAGGQDEPDEFTHHDGHDIMVLRSITSLANNEDQDLMVISFMDVTEHKVAEKELQKSHDRLEQAHIQLKKHKDQIVQSEKLASIGQLAAGVAHEINNPIGYVTSNLSTMSEYADTMKDLIQLYEQLANLPVDQNGDRAKLAAEIEVLRAEEDLEFILEDLDNVLRESMEGTHRVAEIVASLKGFAREDTMTQGPHDINEGIESMIKMVWNELKYKCTVEKELSDLPIIRCQPGPVNQVVMNMLVNASHAMPAEGGVITIGTAVVGEEIEIKISDNGCGMSEETQARIFDPFFTTKDVGQGTGLGLSISHGIISDHDGRIEVTSEEGAGTTFCIYLPLTGSSETQPIQ